MGTPLLLDALRRQDKRVVETQLPKKSGFGMKEKLVAGLASKARAASSGRKGQTPRQKRATHMANQTSIQSRYKI